MFAVRTAYYGIFPDPHSVSDQGALYDSSCFDNHSRMSTLSMTLAPVSILALVNNTEFLTSPSIMQPWVMKERLISAFGPI